MSPSIIIYEEFNSNKLKEKLVEANEELQETIEEIRKWKNKEIDYLVIVKPITFSKLRNKIKIRWSIYNYKE